MPCGAQSFVQIVVILQQVGLNYVKYIVELLEIRSKNVPARGIDIGTGANCIYALLGCKLYNMHILATDIDAEALQIAKQNVTTNKMQDAIELRHNTNSAHVLKHVITAEDGVFDFCMCNPPFFATEEEAIQSIHGNTKTDCHATITEMVTPGGEVAFVQTMIQDSLLLKQQIVWYTTLLGKKSSLKLLKKQLQEQYQAKRVLSKELKQGKTARWVLAWTWTEEAAPKIQIKPIMQVPCKANASLQDLYGQVLQVFSELQWQVVQKKPHLVVLKIILPLLTLLGTKACMPSDYKIFAARTTAVHDASREHCHFKRATRGNTKIVHYIK